MIKEIDKINKHSFYFKLISIIVILILTFSVGIFFTVNYFNNKKEPAKPSDNTVDNNTDIKEELSVKTKLNIIDESSNERPIAVMINNHYDAVNLQSGLQDAYVIYEMQVEYEITRLMALFKDKTTARIGSIRSARHTYLDYVLEHDAIYVHFGWSYMAESQIPSLGINNINGLYDSGFFRDTSLNVAYEHTAFTSMEGIKNTIKNKGYRTTTSKKVPFNYSLEDYDLNGELANNVIINLSRYYQVTFKYDSFSKTYSRFVNNIPNVDYVTKKQYTTKNILILRINNYTIAYPLQQFDNIGSGTGHFITNGKLINIRWEKSSRESPTKYYDLEGNEILLNDGNTYVEIIPPLNTVIYE